MTCWTVQWCDTHSLTVNVLYYRSSQHDDMLNIDSERDTHVQWCDTHSLTVNVLYYRSSQHDDMLNGAVMWYPFIDSECCIIEVANMMTCWTVQWRDTHSLTVNVLYYRSSQHDDMLNGAVMWYPFIDSERVVL